MKISKYDSLKADIFERAIVVPLEQLAETAVEEEDPLLKLLAVEELRSQGRVTEAAVMEDEWLH